MCECPIPALLCPWKRKFQGPPGMVRRIPWIPRGHRNCLPDESGAPKQRIGRLCATAETVWRVRDGAPAPRCAQATPAGRTRRKEGNSEMFPYTFNILQQIAAGEVRETLEDQFDGDWSQQAMPTSLIS